jgi:hypothetical protein
MCDRVDGNMTTQQFHLLNDVAKQEDNSLSEIDNVGIGLPSYFLQPTFSWKDVLHVFLVCRNE